MLELLGGRTLFEFEIVSDGPHRQRTSPYPEQNISQIQAKDIVNGMDSTAFDMEAVSDDSAFDWFDMAETQTIEATEDRG